MSALDQPILIASGSSVLRYIEDAEASPCRLVLRHTQIDGIVTITDLQKLAVRPALFTLVTHLELLMAAAIRARFRDRPEDDWLVLLGDRRERVEQKWESHKAGGLEIDRIAATQFADKRKILVKSGLIGCTRSKRNTNSARSRTCETVWPMPIITRRRGKRARDNRGRKTGSKMDCCALSGARRRSGFSSG